MRLTPLVLAVALLPALAGAAEIRLADAIEGRFVSPYPVNTAEGLVPQGFEFDFSDRRHIRIEGQIEPGDAEKLAAVVGAFDRWNTTIVSLDSGGGDYKEGLALSDYIQRNNLTTFVGPGDTCLSACALAFLGGRQEFLRNLAWIPARYLHVEGRLGFHAPFNTARPVAAGLDDQGAAMIAELFFGQAREAIRELQARIIDWQVTPDFVFDLLGKGPEEFLYIDRYREPLQNRITILASEIAYPRQIGAMEAYHGCSFVLATALTPAEGYGDVFELSKMEFGGHLLTGDVTVKELGTGRAQFDVKYVILGRGPFACRVSNADGNEWRVSLTGDLPTAETYLSNPPRIDDPEPYRLNTNSALGLLVPRTAIGQEDLVLGDGMELFERLPDELRAADGPSFDCGGELDPAAVVICRFPLLAQADATMVNAYKAARKRSPDAARKSQTAWIKERNRLCRVDYVDLDDEFAVTMAGYCLLDLTAQQAMDLTRL